MLVDLFLVYSFIRRLATPFKEWEAYKLGIIDENGNVLKKRKDLLTIKERDAFGIFDIMVLNLKKLLAKVPGGSTRIGSYAAALYLIKEWNHFTDSSLLTEDISDEEITESIELFFNGYSDYTTLIETVNYKVSLEMDFDKNLSETPTVNVGAGNIAGMGVGPQGEPGLTPAQMARYKKKNKPVKGLKAFIKMKEDLATAQHGMIRKDVKHARPAAIPAEKTI